MPKSRSVIYLSHLVPTQVVQNKTEKKISTRPVNTLCTLNHQRQPFNRAILKQKSPISSHKLYKGTRHFCSMCAAFIEYNNTGLFISPCGISELDCATTKTDTAERSISIVRESLQVFFFVLGALAYFQVPPLGGSRD